MLIAYQPVLIIMYEFHIIDNLNLFIKKYRKHIKG